MTKINDALKEIHPLAAMIHGLAIAIASYVELQHQLHNDKDADIRRNLFRSAGLSLINVGERFVRGNPDMEEPSEVDRATVSVNGNH